jgi:hypothetical protein
MLFVSFINGSFKGINNMELMDFEQLKNELFVVQNEGMPFRGKPSDMASDTLSHIIERISPESALFPVIFESDGGIDNYGNYTNKVIFQAVV